MKHSKLIEEEMSLFFTIIRTVALVLIVTLLSGCAEIDVQTPYGTFGSDGKSVKLVLPSK